MVWCQGGVQRSSSEHRTLRHSETSQNPNSDHMACSRIHWPNHHPPLLCRACLPSTGPPKSRLLQTTCCVPCYLPCHGTDTYMSSCWLLNSRHVAPRRSGISLKTHTQSCCRGPCGSCC
uniref:Uncharacterized protein n=1 Tax=Oryctolagus cuniculus TaxID=9986 RepID=A0A5F9DKU0_RABIT